MDRVIVIRIGEDLDLFTRVALVKGKWSSPGNTSLVRESIVNGYSVHVVFCNHLDNPLYITKITNIRQRYALSDIDYPVEGAFGSYESFMEFEPLKTLNITSLPFFNRLKDEISYKTGRQILISPINTDLIVGYYNGFFDGYTRNIFHYAQIYRNIRQPTQGNTTTIFPSSEQDIINELRRLWGNQ